MSFFTSTLLVETGLWEAFKSRTTKFINKMIQACEESGKNRARSEMNRLGIKFYDN